MGDPYIGTGAVVGIALNADSSGTFWSGTPGTEVALQVEPAGLKWSEVCKQETVPVMAVDELHNVTGGSYYKGSVTLPATYLGLEMWFQALMCGAIVTTGAGPYTHTQALADKIQYCRIGYYTQLRNATAKSKRFTNAMITGCKFNIEAEKAGSVSFDWVAPVATLGTEAIPSPTALEPILWGHLAPTINAVTTHRLYSFGFEIQAGSTEGEFCMAAATPSALSYLERSGHRTLAVDISLLHDADVDTLALLTTGLAQVFTFDNAGLTTANRKLVLTLGAGFREGREETDAGWGVKKTSLKYTNRKSTSPWGLYTINGDTAIP